MKWNGLIYNNFNSTNKTNEFFNNDTSKMPIKIN